MDKILNRIRLIKKAFLEKSIFENEELRGESLNLQLLANDGQKIDSKHLELEDDGIYRLPASTLPGTYYINISTSKRKMTVPMVIC